MHFATLVEKQRGVRDDIKCTRTNLKIVRLGIAQTHGWVELAPTVPTSSSHRSSTVNIFNEVKVDRFLYLWYDLDLRVKLLKYMHCTCHLIEVDIF